MRLKFRVSISFVNYNDNRVKAIEGWKNASVHTSYVDSLTPHYTTNIITSQTRVPVSVVNNGYSKVSIKIKI